MKTFLNEAMELRNMSVGALSEKTGIGAKKIENYIAGKPTPSLADAIELSKALDITLDEFVYGIKVKCDEEACACEACECEKAVEEVVEVVENALVETIENEEEAAMLDDGIVKEEYDDDDDMDEICPEYLLEAALHANNCVNIVTTSDKVEVVKLCNKLKRSGVNVNIYVSRYSDTDEDFYKEVYYVAFKYRFELTVKDIRKMTKTKVFEAVSIDDFKALSDKMVRV